MALGDISDPQAIIQAIAEYDRLGQSAFLERYGYHPAREYVLVFGERRYDSKAVVGAAHGFQFPEAGPLRSSDFSGGRETVQKKLAELGFKVDRENPTTDGPFSFTVHEAATPLDCTFHVEPHESRVTLVLDSRYGRIGSARVHNSQYAEGFELLLLRLAELELNVTRVTLHPTRRPEGALLSSPDYTFPIALKLDSDFRALRLAIGRSCSAADRRPGARGKGNDTKRLRIYLSGSAGRSLESLGEFLSLGSDAGRPTPSEKHGRDGRKPTDVRDTEGQGFGLSQDERKAVEDRAMKVAYEFLDRARWEIHDVSSTKPYDYCCHKDGIELHVEVKGSTTSGSAVLLTKNEVEHARQYRHVALLVVSGISLQRGNPPVASGGHERYVYPWVIRDEGLRPLTFRYDLDVDG